MISKNCAALGQVRRRNSLALRGSVALAVLAFAGSVAHAQSTPPQAEIVVTAQKRAENLKDVPVSVSVLGGAAIQTQKIKNFEDLGRMVPSMAVTSAGGSNLSRITLRGIASDQGTATVGVYLDDVSLTIPNLYFTGATLPKMFDLAQAEVLRGPQGTLFGASSLGGTIRFISNQPNLSQIEGSVLGELSGTHHGGANYLAQGVLNLPIINDRMALRIGVQRSRDSGYIDRIDNSGRVHDGVNDEVATVVRSSLLWKVSDEFSIQPALLYQETNSDGVGLFELSALPKYIQHRDSREFNNDRLIVPSLTIRGSLGSLDVTSVTSYLNRVNKRNVDAQIYDSEYIGAVLDPDFGATYNTIAALPGLLHNNAYVHQWSQEVRLATKSMKETGLWYEWQIGGYFSNQNIHSTDDEYVVGLGAAVQKIFGQDPAAVLGAPLVNDVLGFFHYHDKRREYAVFGQGSVRLLPKLKATIGVRQSFARVGYDIDQGGWLALGSPPTASRKSTSKPFTPKFALVYEASQSASIYATVGKGFRLGGFTTPLPPTCGPSVAEFGLAGSGDNYRSDSLWSYEGGAKFDLFGRKLRVNASGYYIDWQHVQQSISLPSCGFLSIVNAGHARSYGGEIEAEAQVAPGLSIGGSASFTDSRVTKAAPGTGVMDGQSLLGVPKNNFSGHVDYRQSINDEFKGYGHIDVNRVGRSHGAFAVTSPDYDRAAYTVVNATVGIETDRFDISLFARNLLDERKVIQSPQVVFVRQGLIVRPRTIGISARVKL
ncbi:MAG TPA: TonB-dependent receptor [Sphingobium sp.]|uniref:TonB-dependent receptor n=1 Tax=Sphingobium sp. TaxID=1912891 RepID=UPI002ED35DCB